MDLATAIPAATEPAVGNTALQHAQDAYDAFKRGDIGEVLELVAADVDWQAIGPTLVPVYGHWHGRDEVAQYFALLAEHLDIESFEVKEYVTEGERVVALVYVRATVKATGRQYDQEGAHVLTVRDDKIVQWRAYADTAEVLAAFRPPA